LPKPFPEQQLAALSARARVILATVFGDGGPSGASDVPPTEAPASAREALPALARRLDSWERSLETKAVLASLATLARYPSHEEARDLAEAIRAGGAAACFDRLLRGPEGRALHADRHIYELVPTAGRLLADVSHTVATPGVSGIRRVIRELFRAWPADGPALAPIAWLPGASRLVMVRPAEWAAGAPRSAEGGAPTARPARAPQGRLRALLETARRLVQEAGRAAVERLVVEAADPRSPWAPLLGRIVARIERVRGARFRRRALFESDRLGRTEVPLLWNAAVLLPEVLGGRRHVSAYEGARRTLPVTLTTIAYDLLPVTHVEHFEARPAAEFLNHLRLLSCVDRASCISGHVEREVRALAPLFGRSDARPLRTAAHALPAPEPTPLLEGAAPAPLDATAPPLMIAVGTIEPRKNGIAVLRAAARLARSGVRLRLVFLGGTGWLAGPFLRALAEERAAGLDVELLHDVDDATLAQHYARCRFSVFCSHAEGFGLPIVESLSRGRPVLTSDKGGMAEIALGGGCLLVDPSDVDAIAGGMRRLLTDDALHARLSAEAAARPLRRWADYARDIRDLALAPLASPAAPGAAAP